MKYLVVADERAYIIERFVHGEQGLHAQDIMHLQGDEDAVDGRLAVVRLVPMSGRSRRHLDNVFDVTP
eukprot:2659703-Pyramimonas_sp.AAC.1